MSDLLVERIGRQMEAARLRAAVLRARVPEMARALRARGAVRVVLFGSLATGKPPHERTDIDLCVWGLDPRLLTGAWSELEVLVGAEVDLVRWESASQRLRRRVAEDGVEVDDGA